MVTIRLGVPKTFPEIVGKPVFGWILNIKITDPFNTYLIIKNDLFLSCSRKQLRFYLGKGRPATDWLCYQIGIILRRLEAKLLLSY